MHIRPPPTQPHYHILIAPSRKEIQSEDEIAKVSRTGMSTSASVEAGKADERPAALEEFVTLVVTDEEGRRPTH